MKTKVVSRQPLGWATWGLSITAYFPEQVTLELETGERLETIDAYANRLEVLDVPKELQGVFRKTLLTLQNCREVLDDLRKQSLRKKNDK